MIETKTRPATYTVMIEDPEVIDATMNALTPFLAGEFEAFHIRSQPHESDLHATEALDNMVFTLARIISPDDSAIMSFDRRMNPLYTASSRKDFESRLGDSSLLDEEGHAYKQVTGISEANNETANDTYTVMGVDIKFKSDSMDCSLSAVVDYEPFQLPAFDSFDEYFNNNETLHQLN